jgi:hypothetical protein
VAKSTALVPLQGDQLLTRVDELVLELGENFFELGSRLFEIKAGEVYKERDYGSWVEYCDAALPFQYRKADHYIELWELYCHKLGYDYNEINHVGWSKLVKVKGLISNKRDAKKWIKQAESHSRRQLETLVKREHQRRRAESPEDDRPPTARVEHDTQAELEGVHETTDRPAVNPELLFHDEISFEDGETGETVPLHQFQVYLFNEQWANVMAAMNRAGQLANSEKAGHLLDLICDEFNNTYADDADGGVAHSLDRHIKNLERIYEVKIEVEVPKDSRLRKMSRLDGEKPEKKEKSAKQSKKGKKKPEYKW